jgi:hypothetical protein
MGEGCVLVFGNRYGGALQDVHIVPEQHYLESPQLGFFIKIFTCNTRGFSR